MCIRDRYCVASSSTPPKLEAALKLVGLWDAFAPHVFSTAQVAHGKPAPDVFLFAARQMQMCIRDSSTTPRRSRR